MVIVMKGQYDVAGYQGRLSVRFVPDNSTTVYADTIVASFDNEADANAYANDNEGAYYDNYWQYAYDEHEAAYYGRDNIDYFACDCCGALHSNDCKCDD
jgi:hypothetical protein